MITTQSSDFLATSLVRFFSENPHICKKCGIIEMPIVLSAPESSLKFFILTVITVFSIIVPALIAVAYFTLVERKVMGAMQRRKGPNVVGFWGFLQPLADGLKLVLKEMLIPAKAHSFIFLLAPVITLSLSLLNWAVIPVTLKANYSDVNLSLLLLFGISSLGVYGIIFAGWASNSKYAFLGSVRSAAQMISYEVSLGFIFVMVAMLSGSLNLIDIVLKQQDVWFVFPLFPISLIFLVIMLAETNRTPFDLPEAEAELVAGYNVEYSSIAFAMFFLGEYSSMLAIASLYVILFLGGWLPLFGLFGVFPGSFIFAVKVSVLAFFFIWVRATLPRYRYDQLMSLGWKKFLPFTLGYLFLCIGFILGFDQVTPVSEFSYVGIYGEMSYLLETSF